MIFLVWFSKNCHQEQLHKMSYCIRMNKYSCVGERNPVITDVFARQKRICHNLKNIKLYSNDPTYVISYKTRISNKISLVKQTIWVHFSRSVRFKFIESNMKYGKQDRQEKAAFKERNSHKTEQHMTTGKEPSRTPHKNRSIKRHSTDVCCKDFHCASSY
jgi:hypothetical protein